MFSAELFIITPKKNTDYEAMCRNFINFVSANRRICGE